MKPKPPSGFQLRTIPENRLAKPCVSQGARQPKIDAVPVPGKSFKFLSDGIQAKGEGTIASLATRNAYRENMCRDLFVPFF